MKYTVLAILICSLLVGCSPTKAENTRLKLVEAVEIEFYHQQEYLHRIYTQPDKIDVILHYLHRLTPRGIPDFDPEQLLGERCKVTVRLSHGESHIYRLQGKEYLSVDLKPWKNISRERCSVLYHLVRKIEGDVIPQATAPTEKAVSAKSEMQN